MNRPMKNPHRTPASACGLAKRRRLPPEAISNIPATTQAMPSTPNVDGCSPSKMKAARLDSKGPVPRAMGYTTDRRSEEGRVGKEGVSTCRFRWWAYHSKNVTHTVKNGAIRYNKNNNKK